jgi:polysaccharide deacetylase 2 family uncharacterized protein YibQ
MPPQKKRRPPARKSKKKYPRKRKAAKPSMFKRVMSALLGMGALVLIVIIVGYFAHLFFAGGPLEIEPPETSRKTDSSLPLEFEIYPEEIPKTTEKKEASPPATLPPEGLPLACIIIDDVGYDKHLAEQLLGLDAPFTFSVLPFSPFREEISRSAVLKGVEIMLHLPMEPEEYPRVDPGPGALLTSMSPDELIRQLTEDIRSVPGARGVNNHMGSKMTAVSSQMYQVFSILKKEGLFFIDSRTTINTLCKPSARLLQVPFAERDVFLDHVETADFVRKQIYELIRKAEQEGRAIGIGHPHEVTIQVLDEMLPELKKRVRLVPASRLVERLG